VTVGGEIRFPFRARWIAAGLAAGLSLSDIREMHFCLLVQIVGCSAISNGAKLEWAHLLQEERETLRNALDRLNTAPCLPLDSKLRSDWIVPPPSEGWPISAEAPNG